MSNYEKIAQKFLEDCNAKMTVEFLRNAPYFNDDKESRDIYEITLERDGKSYKFTFGQSLADSGLKPKKGSSYLKERKKPTAYSVLACLTKYEPESDVWEFAREFGYEINSRKDFNRIDKICMSVMDEYRNVCKLFGDRLEQLAEIS